MKSSKVILISILVLLFGFFSIFLSILSSAFGIWVAGDYGIREVLLEIDQDYEREIQNIRTQITYDEFNMTGTRADWKSILSIYAVKISMDPEAPQEVFIMDEERRDLLTDVFWEMNEIRWETEIIPETESAEATDSEYSETAPPPKIRLLIHVSHKSVNEMARLYNFDAQQLEMLEQLLSADNARMWNDVIYGFSTGLNGDIVAVAASQIGNYNGNPYWSWYGFGERVEWCAIFVSWCANECGYISAGIIPRYAGVGDGVEWFKEHGQWQEPDYIPQPGDIIFFDYAGNTTRNDHTGIVEKVEGGYIYTIEGNASNAVKRCRYPFGFDSIKGYGTPAYEDLYNSPQIPDTSEPQTTASGVNAA